MSSASLVGRTIARYRIVERLGAGGMGEVFKAIDTALQRPVALKILPPEVVHDQERLRRFVREAQSASALNHPNIVTIHDVGSAHVNDGDDTSQTVHYIAMELIEGTTMRAQIYGGAEVEALLKLMQQVADAVAMAHGAGILHRDLKPDNIMVTCDGRAKVVDFGLAKLMTEERPSPDDATLQMETTREGTVVGTVGYMSPEQIVGCAIDGRSDIFSFGCVLYEAVCRQKPFVGEDYIDTLNKIQRVSHAKASSIDARLPAALDRITDRCLAKDPDDRYQSMKEVVVELKLLLRHLNSVALEVPAARAVTRPRKRRALWWTAAMIGSLAILGLFLGLARLRETDVDLSTYRFTPLETTPAYEGAPAYSPDGRTIAYVADVNGVLQVFTRGLDGVRGVQLTHSIQDCQNPFWTPDGREVYYISAAGDRDGLWAVGAAGGTARVVVENVAAAALSPDGRTLAFLREERGQSGLRLWLASPPTSPPHAYVTGDFASRTFLAGTLMFSPDSSALGAWLSVGNVAGVPMEFWLIDPVKLTARRLLPSLSDVTRPEPFSWMPDSRRIVFSGSHGSDRTNGGAHLWMADTADDRVRALTASSASEVSPTVSPDGKKIVFAQEDLDFDLVNIPLDAPHIQPLLSTARSERDPAWSPAGNGFAYVTNRSGTDEIWFHTADWERPIATSKDFGDRTPTSIIFGLAFSPDGQRIAYLRRGAGTRIWVSSVLGGPALPLGGELTIQQAEEMGSPTWSPDSSAIAFVAIVAGRPRLSRILVGSDARAVPFFNDVTKGLTRWSPNGLWLTASTASGFFLVSPDGNVTRKISDETWLVHAWSPDSSAIYGMRLDDDLHLLLSRLSVEGSERVLGDLGTAPPVTIPLNGFSLSPDGKTFLTGLMKPKGDLWMLEGFENETPWWRRAFRF
jgi:Tol biopolymer transport system component